MEPVLQPHYDFDEFQSACRDRPTSVDVLLEAYDNARSKFGLTTKEDIKAFVGDGGFSDRRFVKTDPFRASQSLNAGQMMVDVYDFWTEQKYGYLAIVRNPNTLNWLIKSLDLNQKQDPRRQVSPSFGAWIDLESQKDE